MSFIFISFMILHIQTLTLGGTVDVVIVVSLNMWVNDGDHLSSFVLNLLLHFYWIWKVMLVPSKISLSICMFNIQPYHVIRNIEFIKVGVHFINFSLVLVVPFALMISYGKEWR